MSKKTHMFDSKAQWRWAFATHQEFAHRWGEATKGRFKALPRRKGRVTARTLLRGDHR